MLTTRPAAAQHHNTTAVCLATHKEHRELETVILSSIASDIVMCLLGRAMDNWAALGFSYIAVLMNMEEDHDDDVRTNTVH